ncbi:MAG: hypothetical protein HKN63_04100 [Rhodobacteraceae bacterium]|nr:hypothetical protein [Paracoccaceae bacterium]
MGAPFVYGRVSLDDLPPASVSFPILSVVMVSESWRIAAATALAALLTLAALYFWRRPPMAGFF